MHYLFPDRIFLHSANNTVIYLSGQSLVDIKIYNGTMSIRLLMTYYYFARFRIVMDLYQGLNGCFGFLLSKTLHFL